MPSIRNTKCCANCKKWTTCETNFVNSTSNGIKNQPLNINHTRNGRISGTNYTNYIRNGTTNIPNAGGTKHCTDSIKNSTKYNDKSTNYTTHDSCPNFTNYSSDASNSPNSSDNTASGGTNLPNYINSNRDGVNNRTKYTNDTIKRTEFTKKMTNNSDKYTDTKHDTANYTKYCTNCIENSTDRGLSDNNTLNHGSNYRDYSHNMANGSNCPSNCAGCNVFCSWCCFWCNQMQYQVCQMHHRFHQPTTVMPCAPSMTPFMTPVALNPAPGARSDIPTPYDGSNTSFSNCPCTYNHDKNNCCECDKH